MQINRNKACKMACIHVAASAETAKMKDVTPKIETAHEVKELV